MSAKWKALDANEKQNYFEEAKIMKEEFDKARKQVNQQVGVELTSKSTNSIDIRHLFPYELRRESVSECAND